METAISEGCPANHSQADRLRVLVVDDDPIIVQVLKLSLEGAGHHVLTAANGRQGLENILQYEPHLVITDWQMPIMNGLELCQVLRNLKATRLVYIIMLTLRSDEEDLVQAFEAGADDYITKPFNPRVLEARIQAAERLIRLQWTVLEENELNRRHSAELAVMNQIVQAERDRAQLYLDTAEVMLLALDNEGGVELINRKGCEILGYSEDELVHKNWFDFCVPAEERSAQKDLFKLVIHRGQTMVRYHESAVINSQGERRLIAWHNNVIRNPDGAIIGYLSSGHDVSAQKQEQQERERLQRQLHQAQKMESIGHLTGGIAHDFNNILASMLGYCTLATERTQRLQDATLQRYLDEIQSSGNRAKDLVAKMLAYSRGTGGAPKPIDIKAALTDTVSMLRGMIPPSIELTVQAEEEIPLIHFDLINFQQVMINLCVNARDALQGKGRINITARHASLEHAECASCHCSVRGRFLELSVADNGPGITPHILLRIFEPFFTTKEVGKGSGLGLSVVHGIVHEQNGHVSIDTCLGSGTRFRLYFPLQQG